MDLTPRHFFEIDRLYNDITSRCPICLDEASRHSKGKRVLHGLTGDFQVTYSKYKCYLCDACFNSQRMQMLAFKRARYTRSFQSVALYFAEVLTLEDAYWAMFTLTGIKVPMSTIHDFQFTGKGNYALRK